jgi:hypothetical protein
MAAEQVYRSKTAVAVLAVVAAVVVYALMWVGYRAD